PADALDLVPAGTAGATPAPRAAAGTVVLGALVAVLGLAGARVLGAAAPTPTAPTRTAGAAGLLPVAVLAVLGLLLFGRRVGLLLAVLLVVGLLLPAGVSGGVGLAVRVLGGGRRVVGLAALAVLPVVAGLIPTPAATSAPTAAAPAAARTGRLVAVVLCGLAVTGGRGVGIGVGLVGGVCGRSLLLHGRGGLLLRHRGRTRRQEQRLGESGGRLGRGLRLLLRAGLGGRGRRVERRVHLLGDGALDRGVCRGDLASQALQLGQDLLAGHPEL